jgi:hypothetical protein
MARRSKHLNNPQSSLGAAMKKTILGGSMKGKTLPSGSMKGKTLPSGSLRKKGDDE